MRVSAPSRDDLRYSRIEAMTLDTLARSPSVEDDAVIQAQDIGILFFCVRRDFSDDP